MTEAQQVPVVPVESQRPPQQPLRPHRGGVVLALGILGLVVCFICGIIAWIMSKTTCGRWIQEEWIHPVGDLPRQAGFVG
jgi:hypothetical protein